ncbi:DUF3617 family protein [Aurantiacibacter sp. MUD11]|uniref:DUF3617 domain-containing protein n=1 Tax=Aurantiacibacter sp. MUD11 TaxID=3003265 RepID=UPI0022AB23F1|nr:DUF3617 family protein [Aurantiacibacter sp. MUD11]WAT17788.1 DUF3617 family protein [Aurantiacibacter sp. MUD11]
MRLIHALPLLAGLALVACDNSAEEASEEALSMDEVLAEIEDNGVMPQPGQYGTTLELISFEMPGATSIDMSALQEEFAEGAASDASYCVTEEMTREAWISEMTDNTCTVSRLTADGNDFNLAMTCDAADGPQGRILMTGTATETGSDMEMAFNQPIPGVGDATIRMRVISERTGDCS